MMVLYSLPAGDRPLDRSSLAVNSGASDCEAIQARLNDATLVVTTGVSSS